MKTEFIALIHRHEAHLLRLNNAHHILSQINADLNGDEAWSDESIIVQYPAPEALVEFVLAESSADDDEEE